MKVPKIPKISVPKISKKAAIIAAIIAMVIATLVWSPAWWPKIAGHTGGDSEERDEFLVPNPYISPKVSDSPVVMPPPNSATATPLPAAKKRADPEVLRNQKYLLALGCDPGPLDGIWGPKTRAAVACRTTQMRAAASAPKTLTAAETCGSCPPTRSVKIEFQD